MKKDRILKDILKEIAIDISKYLLGIEVDNSIEIIDKEFFKIEKREADLLFKFKNSIFQIEIQNDYHSKMHLRMLRYFSDLAYEFENYNIYQYVIYIGKKEAQFNLEYHNVDMNFRYRFIDMRNIDCRLFLNSNKPEKIILAILCDFKNEEKETIINEILIKLKQYSKDNYEFRKNIEMLEILATNRDLENLVDKGVNMLSQLTLEDIPIYRRIIEKGRQEGIEKGRQEGIEKGRQEGKKEGIIKGKVIILKELGFNNEEISKRLNISIEEIEKLLKD